MAQKRRFYHEGQILEILFKNGIVLNKLLFRP